MRYRPLPPGSMPSELADKEEEMLIQRRKVAEIPFDRPRVGVALSGGGIRSATFSLGVLQGLAHLKLLRSIDYLSTVSGGGYAGSFLGGLFCPRGDGVSTPLDVETELGAPYQSSGPVAKSLAWLRENGRYLTPGGSGDSLLAAGTVLRNWVAVQVVLALLLLMGFLALDGLLWSIGWQGTLSPMSPGGWFALIPSPWFTPALGVLGAGGVLFGWAYWLVDQKGVDGRRGMIQHPSLVLILSLLAGLALLMGGGTFPTLDSERVGIGLALFLMAGAVALFLSVAFSTSGAAEARRSLTRVLRMVLLVTIALALLALVDTVGWTVWHAWFKEQPPSAAGAPAWQGALDWTHRALRSLLSSNGIPLLALSFAVAFRERLSKLLGPKAGDGYWTSLAKGTGQGLLAILALLVALAWFGAFSALGHRLTFGPVPAGTAIQVCFTPTWEWVLVLVGLGVLNGILGRVIGFLNLSTLGPFYTAALTRAYVGASNHGRREGDTSPDRLDADDIPWEAYTPWINGGPLHLINVTLNETTGGRSQVIQKDRKGLGLAIGPAGISLSTKHHALQESREVPSSSEPPEGFHAFSGSMSAEAPLFEPESLTVGQWTGVSGAAFTTGLGARTSFSRSLLLGFLNVRLGYWWWTGLAPSRRLLPKGGKPVSAVSKLDRIRLFFEACVPVHAHLLGEWFARFPGSASRHWYLSDGGHHENTGLFELIRRRLPLILACDNGQDPGRKMGDLANLVAKARVDLGVEVTFLDKTGLDRVLGAGQSSAFGTLDDLVNPKAPALAVLAELHYGEGKPGLLIVLKPTLAPNLPLDLLAYAKANSGFPQQSTLDQFFDEAQWEAYRALGEVIAKETLGGLRELFVPSGSPLSPSPELEAPLKGHAS